MKKVLLTCLIFILTYALFASFIIIDSQPQPEHDAVPPLRNLPFQPPALNENLPRNVPTTPVRPVAEFDQMAGALIRYPLGIPIELVRVLSLEDRVVTLVANQTVLNQANTAFTNGNVNMENVEFIIAPNDSYWTRDYGPWFSFDGEGELNVIDFTYNRPRPNDNAFNNRYAQYDTLAIYNMGLVHCGGNYMTDGHFIGASSHIALTENGNNINNVNQRVYDYLGISEYHIVQDPNNTYIDHIDCWGKFLSPDTVLIRSVNTTHPQYAMLEETADYFANHISAWGHSFKVVRVHTPSNQPYTNSLILNKRVFVPLMNHATYDEAALQAYSDAMPGYSIIGVLNNTSNPWMSTDALHCRVKELADRRVVYIDHVPLASDMVLNNNQVEIYANITSTAGIMLNEEAIKVYYKINQEEFQEVNMHSITTDLFSGYYQATIPNIADKDTLYYYIKAENIANITGLHPFVGEEAAHKSVITAPVSISDHPIMPIEMNVYPNPLHLTNENSLRIDVNGSKNGVANISIYNIRGQKITEESFEVRRDTVNTKNLNLSNQKIASGLYFIRYNDEENVVIRRVMIVR